MRLTKLTDTIAITLIGAWLYPLAHPMKGHSPVSPINAYSYGISGM